METVDVIEQVQSKNAIYHHKHCGPNFGILTFPK